MSKRKSKILGQFTWQPIEMKDSPAWRVLSLSGRRILDRLEIELRRHGGKDNGKLPCTYDHFVEYGMDRHSVGPAVREVEALGFVEVTERGRGGNAEFRRPSLYRLTYQHTDDAQPTDDWRRIKTLEAAIAARQAAKRKLQCEKRPPKPVLDPPTEKRKIPVRNTPTTGRGNSPTTSIYREGERPNRFTFVPLAEAGDTEDTEAA